MWKKLNSLPFETLECQNWGFRVIGKRLKLEKIWFLQKAPILVPKDWTIETCPNFWVLVGILVFFGVFWRFLAFFWRFLVFFSVFSAPKCTHAYKQFETCKLVDGNGFDTPKNPQIDPLNIKIGWKLTELVLISYWCIRTCCNVPKKPPKYKISKKWWVSNF